MGSNVDIRLVILGLDGAGKTTILYKLKVKFLLLFSQITFMCRDVTTLLNGLYFFRVMSTGSQQQQ